MLLALFSLHDPLAWLAVAAGWLAALWLALAIDWRWGEPAAAWHPVVWMGRYLGLCGQRLKAWPPAAAFVGGALAWWAGAVVVGGLAGGLQWLVVDQWLRLDLTALALSWAWLAWAGLALLLAIALKPMLAWRMLRSEVLAVEAALQTSLPDGRKRLTWLVSRATASLSDSEVRESAIESLAENLNDSVVAPIFWFVLLGLPGAAVYRFANTADAMWGYRGEWEWAGKCAARADDVLSWVPARLTAGLIWLVAGDFRLAGLRREAVQTPSPNSGWPMAAMALALGVALRKPGVYVLNPAGRAPQAVDTLQAIAIASKVILTLAAFALPATVLIAFGMG
ncbi:adenosylcobinamide-phosphate synthase CbiB [Polaromonas sp. UC242_47]|uniref:adenosylcobinamide-phosphate synthase CbiB n=1 Tax=Polaromonas sp. UC242_47 TaxID=3374626 RepID=UPI00379FFA70